MADGAGAAGVCVGEREGRRMAEGRALPARGVVALGAVGRVGERDVVGIGCVLVVVEVTR